MTEGTKRHETTFAAIVTAAGSVASLISIFLFVVDRAPVDIALRVVATALVVLGVVITWRARPSATWPWALALVATILILGAWVGGAFGGAGPDQAGADGPVTPTAATPETKDLEPDGSSKTPVDTLCAQVPEPTGTELFAYVEAGATEEIVIERDDAVWRTLTGFAMSASGSWLAYVDANNSHRVHLVDLAAPEEEIAHDFERTVTDTTVASDGRTVVVVEQSGGDTRLTLWHPYDSPNEAPVQVIETSRSRVAAPALDPQGGRLAWEHEDGILVADLPHLANQTRIGLGGDPAWAPDGSALVYSAPTHPGRAVYAAVPGDDPHRLTRPGEAADRDPVVTPGCDAVVYARSRDGTVALWQTALDGDITAVELRAGPGAQTRPAYLTIPAPQSPR